MEGILQSFQLVPHGVVCLTHGSIDLSAAVGVDLLNEPVTKTVFIQSLVQQEMNLDGPLKLRRACLSCEGRYFLAKLPVVSDSHQIELNGEIYNRWGYVDAHISWELILERSQIHRHMQGHGFEFQLTQVQPAFNEKKQACMRRMRLF